MVRPSIGGRRGDDGDGCQQPGEQNSPRLRLCPAELLPRTEIMSRHTHYPASFHVGLLDKKKARRQR